LYFSGFSVAPTLNLNFTTMTALPSTITFSRPSNATYYDSTGKLTYAPNNLLLNSATLSTQNVTTAPINYILSFQGTGSVVLSGTFIGTLTGTGVSNRVSVAFTPTAGTLTLTVAGSVTSAQLEAVTYQTTPSTYVATTSAAYYGARLDYNPATLAARGLLIEEARTNTVTYSDQINNVAWTNNNNTITTNAAISPDGAQNAELLTPTTTNTFHRVFNPTNTLTATSASFSCYSKANGYTKAFIRESQTSGAAVVFDLSSGTVFSIFNNGGSTISNALISSVGNGWYKLSFTASFASATNMWFGFHIANPAYTSGDPFSSFFAGDGTSGMYLWGAQLEAGSFPTSYIPTAASSVARSADTASMTGTNFSSWYNQSEGTFVVNTTPLSATNINFTGGVFTLSPTSGVGGGSFDLGQGAAGTWKWWRSNGNMMIDFGTVSANTSAKLAVAYKLADYAAVANNGTVGTSSEATALVSATSINLSGQFANSPFGGYLASIVFYPQRLPNATLQSLTS
jgi:hypothetical protein